MCVSVCLPTHANIMENFIRVAYDFLRLLLLLLLFSAADDPIGAVKREKKGGNENRHLDCV